MASLAGRRRAKVRRIRDDLVRGVNWLHGAGRRPPRNGRTILRDRELQEEVLLHFETSSVAFEGMLSANPGEESLRELLRGRGPYGGSSISATIAPIRVRSRLRS